jgi:hypothetical protein
LNTMSHHLHVEVLRRPPESAASIARSDRNDREACQPTTMRENTSTMNATYTQPEWVLT